MTPSERKFIPKPGQTDYTNIRRAPVINCVVRHNNKILLVQRSKKMRLYPGVWAGISGFLDEAEKTIEHKVKEELLEEAGIEEKDILSITTGTIIEREAPDYDKTWVVHPVLVEVVTNRVSLNWEGQEYEWVYPEEISRFDTLPGFPDVIKILLK